jgi:hypothetical protein
MVMSRRKPANTPTQAAKPPLGGEAASEIIGGEKPLWMLWHVHSWQSWSRIFTNLLIEEQVDIFKLRESDGNGK